jgi:hypothetical protein
MKKVNGKSSIYNDWPILAFKKGDLDSVSTRKGIHANLDETMTS